MAEEETPKRIRKSPQERREEVLDAAVQLISERGFNGISIQDVADRVGISSRVCSGMWAIKQYAGDGIQRIYGETGTPEDFLHQVCLAVILLRRYFLRICVIWCGIIRVVA